MLKRDLKLQVTNSCNVNVVVTAEYFENVVDVISGQSVTLPCTVSPDFTVVWYYQRYCDNFDYNMYLCSHNSEVATSNRYEIRRNASGENNLLINYVTKNMTGLYMCKDRDSDVIHYKVLLNVISKYSSVLFYF